MKTIKLKLTFPPSLIKEPFTYNLIKSYNLMVNILHADIKHDKKGVLIIDLSGNEWDIEEGLRYINNCGIQYKLFTKKIIWNENECVHCGACTAVCPSGALTMDKEKWELSFCKDKCMICEICVNACPIKVISVSI